MSVVFVVGLLMGLGALVAVQLTYWWEPTDAGSTGHATVVRYVGIALAGVLLAAGGHRRLFALPAIAIYAVPALFGHQLDLSGDTAETSWLQIAAELALLLTPPATFAYLRRRSPAGALPSPVAMGIGGAAVVALLASYLAAEQPYPHVAQVASGQVVATAIVTTLLARRPRLMWSVLLLPLLLWHEPLVEVLYLSRSAYGPAAREYYAFAAWAVVVGGLAPLVDVLRTFARSRPPRAGLGHGAAA